MKPNHVCAVPECGWLRSGEFYCDLHQALELSVRPAPLPRWSLETELHHLATNTRCTWCGHSSNARNPHAADCPRDGWDNSPDPWADFDRTRG